MMAAEILTVCDALLPVVVAALDDPGDAVVERLYLAPLTLDTDAFRHVWVFPASYANNPATRAEDEWVYAVGVVVAERYEDAGEPPAAWLDERVAFTQSKVFDALDFARTLLQFGTGSARELWTQSSSCDVVYDSIRLSEKKLFWSELRFEFREILSA